MGSYKKNSGGNHVVAQQPVSTVTRRIIGTASPLRSPVVKRLPSAPVVIQGWLHKQGSEGLMLWKKRWFVLSEYCLFYYKNRDEDKLLGSILLPSYKISPCTAIEGKVFRKKYSFKAEHANMRTYFFAADSKDEMVQWMNSMSLATIAQQHSNGLSQPNNHTKSDNVNFHLLNNHRNHGDGEQTMRNGVSGGNYPTPGRSNERSPSCSSSSGGTATENIQPLYVNAPPKPRRVTDPSEAGVDQDFATGGSPSTLVATDTATVHNDRSQPAYVKKVLANVTQSHLTVTERRTPDVYGRSSSIDPRTLTYARHKAAYKQSNQADYEELYNLTMMNHSGPSDLRGRPYTSLGSPIKPAGAATATAVASGQTSTNGNVSRLSLQNRPRSVDFLEAENKLREEKLVARSNASATTSTNQTMTDSSRYMPPPRPKSSIDIVNADSFYWSEERYAENMRKSAQFLVGKKLPQLDPAKLPYRNSSYDSSGVSSAVGDSVHLTANSRNLTNSIGYDDACRNRTFEPSQTVTTSYASQMFDRRWKDHSPAAPPLRNDDCVGRTDFIRSKSARIPREKVLEERNESALDESLAKRRNSLHSSESGDRSSQQTQQREESMKRLLEWKQRMLQSPLSRKLSGSSNRGSAQNDLFRNYKIPNLTKELSHLDSTVTCRGSESNPAVSSSWHNASVEENDAYVSSDGRCSRMKNLDSSSQSSHTSRDRNHDGQIASNLFKKYSSESSDNEETDKMKEAARKRARRGSQVSSNDSSSVKASSYGVARALDLKNPRSSASLSRPKDDDAGFLSSGGKYSDSGYDTLKADCSDYRKSSDERNSPDVRTSLSAAETRIRFHKDDVPSSNTVQDRIRAFETSPETSAEKLGLKNPLKVSSMQSELNQALVSPLKNQMKEDHVDDDASSTHTFIDDFTRSNSGATRQSKSARDLLLNIDWKTSSIGGDDDFKKGAKNGYSNDDLEDIYTSCNVDENEISVDGDSRMTPSNCEFPSSPVEDHYLPMAPSKKTFPAPPGDLFYHTRSNSASSASQILILETLLSEDIENSYVEMTVGSDSRMYHEPKKVLNGGGPSPDGASAADKSSPSHYEFLYKASSSTEPLYMEVFSKDKWPEKDVTPPATNVAAGTDASSASKRSILPDILNSSNTLRQLTDSSDADDEASKELDPLEVPRHPRFSLSDTFRPASYYLGYGIGYDKNDRSALNLSFDQPDSSDSDLVSPPPIPTSPASLDDFDMSLELLPSSKNESTNAQESYSYPENISLSETGSLNSKGSNFSLKEYPKCDKDTSDIDSTTESYSSTITTLPEAGYDEYAQKRSDRESHVYRGAMTNVPKSKVSDTMQPTMYLTRTPPPPPPPSGSPPLLEPEPVELLDSSTPVMMNGTNHLGAPYYYADLLKSNAETATGISHNILNEATHSPTNDDDAEKNRFLEESLPNNKREGSSTENLSPTKRNDVGKKVNLIAAENHAKLMDMKNTVQLLRMADKNVDDKNIYSSHAFQSKIHKCDYRSKTPEPLSDAINLYAMHSRPAAEHGPLTGKITTGRNRRSRSLEGLLDEPPKNNVGVWNGSGASSQPTAEASAAPASASTPGDIWEEDTLWRENLRRMSLRHARSLDNLDKDGSKLAAVKSGRQSADFLGVDEKKCPKKLSRDVTYVNDCVTAQIRKAKQNSREYTEDYREVRRIKRYVRAPVSADSVDDGVHYERLDPRAALPRSSANYQYVNGNDSRESVPSSVAITNMKQHGKFNMQPKTGAQSFLEEGVYPTKPPSFEIDREKLRQWDLMSSAPVAMLNAIQRYPVPDLQAQVGPPAERSTQRTTQILESSTPPASPVYGSNLAIGRETIPHQDPATVLQHSPNLQRPDANSADPMTNTVAGYHRQLEADRQSPLFADAQAKRSDSTWNLSVSAGELLGRTHEELVLLLIQLRRQSASVCKAMENCHREIESQAKLAVSEASKKMEHLNRLEDLKKRLGNLEKQYEKGKPLVNLVDNMVKLGSLYRAGAPSTVGQSVGGQLREKLEFNHRIQEQRLLAEERKEWERISPDHHQLQAKVEELYKLDRELQQESSTLQSLKQDKDLLENALGGLKHKIQGTQGNPTEMERYRKQQLLLERELSHVRSVLARNSKKLEETVTANARLEAELVVLRQKLQWNQRPSSEESIIGAPTVTALESELKRVQLLVGDLQRQRSELSAQVRQLTEKSRNLCQEFRPSPTGIAGAGPVPAKKRTQTSWTETDLDNDKTHDVSSDRSSVTLSPTVTQMCVSVPLYANTDDKRNGDHFGKRNPISYDDFPGFFDSQYCKPVDVNESDDRSKRFYGILPKEKPQEIKTVRIVKRESERRQRDRDRCGIVGIPISPVGIKHPSMLDEYGMEMEKGPLSVVMEERERDDVLQSGSNVFTLFSDYDFRSNVEETYTAVRRHDNCNVQPSATNKNQTSAPPEAGRKEMMTNATKTIVPGQSALPKQSESPQLSPVYQSEAAKQIVQELVSPKSENNRRLVPKEKRRHHTVSISSKPLISPNNTQRNTRARDDVDMERALRPRLNGTPDVVRSTLSRTDPVKYNADTIDSLFGTPGKILIPERYVPENVPELSPEEQNKRLKKAEAIRKMLSETTALSSVEKENEQDETSLEQKRKIEEEKQQRNRILHLNRILAQQVIEKSKLVTGTSSPNCS